jgi:hypothetical protein
VPSLRVARCTGGGGGILRIPHAAAAMSFLIGRDALPMRTLSAERPTGLIPVFRTEPSTIFVFRKVRNDVEEQAHRGADDRGGQADGSGPEGRGCGPRSGG